MYDSKPSQVAFELHLSLGGTVNLLTLALTAWPARSTCDRILKVIVEWRRGATSSEALTHKKFPKEARSAATMQLPSRTYRVSPHPSLSNPTQAEVSQHPYVPPVIASAISVKLQSFPSIRCCDSDNFIFVFLPLLHFLIAPISFGLKHYARWATCCGRPASDLAWPIDNGKTLRQICPTILHSMICT
jgi:hypothetical protein